MGIAGPFRVVKHFFCDEKWVGTKDVKLMFSLKATLNYNRLAQILSLIFVIYTHNLFNLQVNRKIHRRFFKVHW
jgi:hypothetical protein